jgi:hypothetical protein
MIRFTCPTCGKNLSAPDESAGKIGKCSCGERGRVPVPPPSPMAVADVPPPLIPTRPALSPLNLPTINVSSPQPLPPSQGRVPFSPWAISAAGLALLAALLHFMTCTWDTKPKTKGIPILRFREAVADEGAAQKAQMFKKLCAEQHQKVKQLRNFRSAEKNNARIDEYDAQIDSSLGLWNIYLKHLSDELALSERLQGIWAREGTARDSAMLIGILIPVLLLLGSLVLLFSSLARQPRPPTISVGS